MAYLPFIRDQDLLRSVEKVLRKIEHAGKDAEVKLYKNVLDPFSALFDGITHGISYNKWIKLERIRQMQKTMQNAIGDFHQDILGSITDCENLGTAGGLDICNRKLKVIAEVKNKYNTTKGNHKVEIYDAIKGKINGSFKGFTGYYVEIIPQKRKMYDLPFTPPDNKTKKRRPIHKSIRVIDGKSFYAMMTRNEHALQELFDILPSVITDNFPYEFDKEQCKEYRALFGMAYETM